MLCLIKRQERKEYVWWRRGKVWGKAVPLWAHGEGSSLPPDGPAARRCRDRERRAEGESEREEESKVE